jgi:hypothetical protein
MVLACYYVGYIAVLVCKLTRGGAHVSKWWMTALGPTVGLQWAQPVHLDRVAARTGVS